MWPDSFLRIPKKQNAWVYLVGKMFATLICSALVFLAALEVPYIAKVQANRSFCRFYWIVEKNGIIGRRFKMLYGTSGATQCKANDKKQRRHIHITT
jgi:hypothetical protein